MKKVVLFLMAIGLIVFTLLIVTHIQRGSSRARVEMAASEVVDPEVVNSPSEVSSEEFIQGKTISQREPNEIIPKVININTASLKALETLPHIGPTIAQRIIEYRKAGPFQSIEDITKVSGIGHKTLEKIKGRITVGTIPTHTDISNTSLKGETIPCPEGIGSITAEGDVVSNKEKVNINTATLEGLESLPRIGPELGRRIIEYRSNYGGFKSIEETMKVQGIGPKIFEKIKDMITIGEDG